MTTAIIVQARMGSTRLPGKVLRPIGGRPMLSYQIERLRRVKLAQRLVVATTTEPADGRIAAFCADEGVDYMRGSERDVLARYCDAARHADADVVVRVTSDCPLIDPALVDRAIAEFGVQPACDYVSNMLAPSWPYGMAVEVFARAALDEADAEACRAEEREHVTPFIYLRPERYRLRSLTMQPDLSHYRWTVDTPEDFELVSRVLLSLYPEQPLFGIDDVLALLARQPAWSDINRHVAQKTLSTISKED